MQQRSLYYIYHIYIHEYTTLENYNTTGIRRVCHIRFLLVLHWQWHCDMRLRQRKYENMCIYNAWNASNQHVLYLCHFQFLLFQLKITSAFKTIEHKFISNLLQYSIFVSTINNGCSVWVLKRIPSIAIDMFYMCHFKSEQFFLFIQKERKQDKKYYHITCARKKIVDSRNLCLWNVKT